MINSIQLLRAFAALAVVLCHVLKFMHNKVEEINYGYQTLANVLMIGVDIFFIISGFIIYSSFINKRLTPSQFIERRLVRIYPIFWFVCLLIVPVLLLKPEWVNSASPLPPSLFHSFLLIPHESAPLLMVAWTLEYEVFFYVLFAISLFFKNTIGFLITIFSSLIIIGFVSEPFEDPILQVITSPLLMQFILGIFIAKLYLKTNSSINSKRWLAVSITLFLLSAIILYLGSESFKVSDVNNRVARFTIPAVMIVIGFLLFENFMDKKSRFQKSIIYFGDASYSIYLIHVLTLSAFIKVCNAIDLNEKIGLPLTIFVAFIACTISGCIMHTFIEKPMIKNINRKLKEIRKENRSQCTT
ncbi:acyltransferase [Pseudoalteromonas sp. OOF1S-7]|uniref:acyltransferase family protein n=1 Tax=Pseudoalteromonas sp. OOF1S-7 TaxID=2917757 RepID=UPI001EF5DA7F|nr:acyltransferase [Pseudoalteromonas sp. OOF1S-7]MCG7537354.1 acyltransferase [Pseudoalteromonas sp. OOF1S-7]